MIHSKYAFVLSLLFVTLLGCSSSSEEIPSKFVLEEIVVDGEVNLDKYTDVDPETDIVLRFSDGVDKSTMNDNILLQDEGGDAVELKFTLSNESREIVAKPLSELKIFSDYRLIIQPLLKSQSGANISSGKVATIETSINMDDKHPEMSDEELLDLVQSQTLKYFWEHGHPVSGMARERTTSGNTVTTGGTGFGVMAIIVGSHRGFIERDAAAERVLKIADFLETKCTSYHGAYSHWINGQTGATIAFSLKDDGADIVETSLLFEGLLTAREYFDGNGGVETELRERITRLWEAIEWDWFQRGGEETLYWHWSPKYGWEMNMGVTGWNESLITYLLAASSPTYPIEKRVYDIGWTRDGAFTNGNTYNGIMLPLGPAYGGPLFFAHYSFLGLNPKLITDQYTDYWEQVKSHTLINRAYCIQNPKGYKGYSADCWGLTACDGDKGYSAHSPTNDRGVIAPTAALSSMPYTPEESMQALHYYYYKLGDRLWSEYGFFDSFNLTSQWFDNQHIAIDQGPIVIMIENYRSGLIWELFMNIPEIDEGLNRLGFIVAES